MGARQKLNEASVFGSIVVAGVIGFATDSWTIFAIATAVLLIAVVYNGDIRSRGYRRHRR